MTETKPQTKKLDTLPFPDRVPGRDPMLPTGFWDPSWQKPEVAGRVALDVYNDLSFHYPNFDPLDLLPAEKLPAFAPEYTDHRVFPLAETTPLPGSKTRLRGGGCGEILRQYAFSGKEPGQYFHAQAVAFGADSAGRFFLRANVGRVFGYDSGNKVRLELRFLDEAGETLGGVVWHAKLDLQPELQVLVTGKSNRLKAEFDRVHSARVSFEARPGA